MAKKKKASHLGWPEFGATYEISRGADDSYRFVNRFSMAMNSL